MGFDRPPFRYFESYLRIVLGLDEYDIWLKLKQNNSDFVTFELPPGFYSVKDVSEAVYTIGDHKGTLKNKYDDINTKTKLVLKRLGGTFGVLRFNEKTFGYFIGFQTFLGF